MVDVTKIHENCDSEKPLVNSEFAMQLMTDLPIYLVNNMMFPSYVQSPGSTSMRYLLLHTRPQNCTSNGNIVRNHWILSCSHSLTTPNTVSNWLYVFLYIHIYANKKTQQKDTQNKTNSLPPPPKRKISQPAELSLLQAPPPGHWQCEAALGYPRNDYGIEEHGQSI